MFLKLGRIFHWNKIVLLFWGKRLLFSEKVSEIEGKLVECIFVSIVAFKNVNIITKLFESIVNFVTLGF
jgi:hypothetical protein